MPYQSKKGKRPMEYASKAAHSHVVNDPEVAQFLQRCNLPPQADDVGIQKSQVLSHVLAGSNPISHVIAIDGGYTTVPVRAQFPSATITFFQIGALVFAIEDLERLDEQPFIDPDDMAKLKDIQRLKFAIPTKGMTIVGAKTLTESVRRTIYDFFMKALDESSLMESLKWLIFQDFRSKPQEEWRLASCPYCRETRVALKSAEMTKDYTFKCTSCSEAILLTDVFRLHEAIDDELGAGGVLGYLITTVEQIVMVHMLRLVLQMKPDLLGQILFVKDGPLAFFGQTANLHQPMRALVNHLINNHDLHMAGLEKSGPFVEHADEIARKLDPGTILMLNNEHIFKYVTPGQANPTNPYGSTTYYSNKIIFKSSAERMYVASLPTCEVLATPTESDFHNLHTILASIEKLKCDMYDDALLPIALANKLISLANHPSSRILQKFATSSMS